MSFYTLCEWLQNTETGTAIRESIWVFPIIETAHVLGLALSVGLLVWFDLRLLGLTMRHQNVSVLHKQIMPWSVAGFIIMFVSGTLLFWSNALRAYTSVYFQLKFLFLCLAGVNAIMFELMTKRSMAEWDKAPIPPGKVRLAGLLSLILWVAVITFGRATAYNLF
jgi:hypothetical protein